MIRIKHRFLLSLIFCLLFVCSYTATANALSPKKAIATKYSCYYGTSIGSVTYTDGSLYQVIFGKIGWRNNNLGCITGSSYDGCLGVDSKRFSIFKSIDYGNKAQEGLLARKYLNYTIRNLIDTYASTSPKADRDAYVAYLCKSLGNVPNTTKITNTNLPKIAKLMREHESGNDDRTIIEFKKLLLQTSSLKIGINKSNKFVLTNEKNNIGLNRWANWISSDPKIVTVDSDGIVKGIKKGTVKITVTLGSQSVQGTVTVN